MTDNMIVTISDQRSIKQYQLPASKRKIGISIVLGSIVLVGGLFFGIKQYTQNVAETSEQYVLQVQESAKVLQSLKQDYVSLEAKLAQVILEKRDLEKVLSENQMTLAKLQKEKVAQSQKLAKVTLENERLEREVAQNKIVLALLKKERALQVKELEEKIAQMKTERQLIQAEALKNRLAIQKLKESKLKGSAFQEKLAKVTKENQKLRKTFEANKLALSKLKRQKAIEKKQMEKKIAKMLLEVKKKRKLLAQQKAKSLKQKKALEAKHVALKKQLVALKKRKQRVSKSHTTQVTKVVPKIAKKKLGRRYVWGAEGPGTFDCSGFTSYVYKKTGVNIPRTSRQQSKYGKYVKRQQLRAGDLIFFDTSRRRKGIINHVGIYLGNNKFIHASSAKKKVIITSLKKPFYSQRYKWARRVIH